MKIIKQISEDEFVLKMEEHDLREMISVKIAHDYVQIGANVGIQVENDDWKPYGKFATYASNWIKGYTDVQINIRKFIKVILPLLNSHKYCQEEHLLQEDGKPAYNWETGPFTCRDENDNWYIYIKQEDGEFYKLPLEIYNQIKRRLKMELKTN